MTCSGIRKLFCGQNSNNYDCQTNAGCQKNQNGCGGKENQMYCNKNDGNEGNLDRFEFCSKKPQDKDIGQAYRQDGEFRDCAQNHHDKGGCHKEGQKEGIGDQNCHNRPHFGECTKPHNGCQKPDDDMQEQIPNVPPVIDEIPDETIEDKTDDVVLPLEPELPDETIEDKTEDVLPPLQEPDIEEEPPVADIEEKPVDTTDEVEPSEDEVIKDEVTEDEEGLKQDSNLDVKDDCAELPYIERLT